MTSEDIFTIKDLVNTVEREKIWRVIPYVYNLLQDNNFYNRVIQVLRNSKQRKLLYYRNRNTYF